MNNFKQINKKEPGGYSTYSRESGNPIYESDESDESDLEYDSDDNFITPSAESQQGAESDTDLDTDNESTQSVQSDTESEYKSGLSVKLKKKSIHALKSKSVSCSKIQYTEILQEETDFCQE